MDPFTGEIFHAAVFEAATVMLGGVIDRADRKLVAA